MHLAHTSAAMASHVVAFVGVPAHAPCLSRPQPRRHVLRAAPPPRWVRSRDAGARRVCATPEAQNAGPVDDSLEAKIDVSVDRGPTHQPASRASHALQRSALVGAHNLLFFVHLAVPFGARSRRPSAAWGPKPHPPPSAGAVDVHQRRHERRLNLLARNDGFRQEHRGPSAQQGTRVLFLRHGRAD